MEAIVLAGRFGTRLKHIVTDVPKPMADIIGRPFLSYVLDYLSEQKIERVVLAVGYMSDVIEQYFHNEYKGIEIVYSYEDKPLYTGGAIKKALQLCSANEVFVLNGDTFFDVPLNEMYRDYVSNSIDISIAVKRIDKSDRYGSLIVDNDNRIIGFEEKKYQDNGLINGGIYLLKRNLLNEFSEVFSFETDFLQKQVENMTIRAFPSDGYFIDIGIPEDYYRAQIELAQ